MVEASKEVKFSKEVTIVFQTNEEPAALPATLTTRTIRDTPISNHPGQDDKIEDSNDLCKNKNIAGDSRCLGSDLYESIAIITTTTTPIIRRSDLAELNGDRDSLEASAVDTSLIVSTDERASQTSTSPILHNVPSVFPTRSPPKSSQVVAHIEPLKFLPTSTLVTSTVLPLSSCLMDGETLHDARQRLMRAIQQTKTLSQAFTDRVHSKYRVCLQPVQKYETIVDRINADPMAYLEKVSLEAQSLIQEKDAEKKEVGKLQSQLANVVVEVPFMDVSNATEQLLYHSSGLNLIILPEHEIDPSIASCYPDRQPFLNGERVRGISQASAIAGEAMLDRARRAAALRLARHNKGILSFCTSLHFPTKDGLTSLSDSATTSRRSTIESSSLMSTGPQAGPQAIADVPVIKTSVNKTRHINSGQRVAFSRSATQSAVVTASALISTNSLLNVAPLSDQIITSTATTKKVNAATAALLSKSCVQKTTQQRLKHPHPDSMGGRRRANATKKDEVFHQGYLALTLPPLPSTRESPERKTQMVVSEPTDRAKKAFREIMALFDDGKRSTKMHIINGLRELMKSSAAQLDNVLADTGTVSASQNSDVLADGVESLSSNDKLSTEAAIDPVLTFSVLHSIGLVRNSEKTSVLIQPNNSSHDAILAFDDACPIWSDKLKSLRSRIVQLAITKSADEFNNNLRDRKCLVEVTRSGTNLADCIGNLRHSSSDNGLISLLQANDPGTLLDLNMKQSEDIKSVAPPTEQWLLDSQASLAVKKIVDMSASSMKYSELIEQDMLKKLVHDLAVCKECAFDIATESASIIPIPKSLVSTPLKEKLMNLAQKNNGSNTVTIPRDGIVSVILVWLWANHRKDFQDAFDKSGRYDVDQGCNYLIQIVLETAVRAIDLDMTKSLAQCQGPFAVAAGFRKANSMAKAKNQFEVRHDQLDVMKNLDMHVTSLVSKTLSMELEIDGKMNKVNHFFNQYLEYLDEARLCALQAKAHERTLLANLVSREASMTEPFSHAYISSMVRGGEALGYDQLFESVNDSDNNVSSLIPFDFLKAESDLWEEPCKPADDFDTGMNGEEMMRLAHARAMLRSSLRKLQERYQIRGGTQLYGPFTDHSRREASGTEIASFQAGLKRKVSSLGEVHHPYGTGSGNARTWSVYEPNHLSTPLEWQTDHSENMPYGIHHVRERVRALSLSLSLRSGEPRSTKKIKHSPNSSGVAAAPVTERVNLENGLPRSTREVNWVDIAGIFQSLEIPKKYPMKVIDKGLQVESTNGNNGEVSKSIYAPYVRSIDLDSYPLDSDETESDGDEDSSDEGVLARHQIVLDMMKTRHAAILDARRKLQENRRKSKFNK